MSRLGVVRWLPHFDPFDNTTSNNTNVPLFSPVAREEWLQADALISAAMIAVLIIHAHLCHLTKVGMTTLLALASLAITLLLAPVVGSLLLLCACYRHLASALLKASLGKKFVGLLYGTDAFWALEDDTSLSIINVLALADFSFIVSSSTLDDEPLMTISVHFSDDEPLMTISELIQDRLITCPAPFPKLLSLRKQALGYYYWEKQESINVNEYIRWMDIEDQGDSTITELALQNYVSSVMNAPLPVNHTAGWEILVGRYPIKPSSDLFDAMENGGWITKSCAGVRYPVLFRIHHSIGDGVALVNLLLEALSDPCTRCSTPVPNPLRCNSPSFNKNFVRPKTPAIPEEPEEGPLISSWQESDIPKYTKSSSCDFQSICLDIPVESTSPVKQRRHSCTSFESGNNFKVVDFKMTVRNACHKVWKFIDETKEFKSKLNEPSFKSFDIVVNDRPSGEFLDMMNNATKLESQFVREVSNKNLEFILKKSTSGLSILIKFLSSILETLQNLVRQWSILLFAPASLLNQALTQTQDVNLLHGPRLSGHKVVAWYFEQQDNSDQLLMSMIKRIRGKTGVRFTDVLLTALSASLESFYTQCIEVPPFITVVIPARLAPFDTQAATHIVRTKKFATKVTKITENDRNNKLENKFSVAMLPLPISSESNSKLKLFSKLRQVRKQCDLLRKSPDYLINYWLLRVVASLLPTWLLRPLLRSTHSTLVFSNLPGPTRLTKLAGHTLHDLVFWVPNRTTTGVGVTVLSYAGRLQLGLMADRALVACQQDAQLILDGVATAIQQMDQISSPA